MHETNRKAESPSKEIEDIKKNSMEMSELEDKITKENMYWMGSAAEWKRQRKESQAECW